MNQAIMKGMSTLLNLSIRKYAKKSMAIVINALMKLSKVISFFIYARFVSIAKVLLFYKLRCVMFLKNNNECEKGCFC